MDDESDERRQEYEIEALEAIYGTAFRKDGAGYSVAIARDHSSPGITLSFTLPPTYPSLSPPVYNLATEHFPLRSGDRSRIDSQLSELYMDNMGAEVLHLWIESLRDFIAERTPKEAKGPENDALTHSPTDARRADELAAAVAPLAVDEPQGEEETYEIIEGDQIVDRKSVFQAYLCRVETREDALAAIESLKRCNRRVARATHNMTAYRVATPTGKGDETRIISDCDDDGEHGAGARLAHLLDILHATNVVVIVARWYGGIQLGPDRFKHINRAAEKILKDSNAVQSTNDESRSKKKKR